MDDYDNRFAPGYGTEFTRDAAQLRDLPSLALQDVSASTARPTYAAISPGPPIADHRQKKKRRSPELDDEFDSIDDHTTMIVKGHA